MSTPRVVSTATVLRQRAYRTPEPDHPAPKPAVVVGPATRAPRNTLSAPRGSLGKVSFHLRTPRARRAEPPVYRITGARRSVGDDVDYRARRYLLSMGIRTACFVAAVATDGWVRWSLMIAAIVLPYLSVVFANGGRESVDAVPVGSGADADRAIERYNR